MNKGKNLSGLGHKTDISKKQIKGQLDSFDQIVDVNDLEDFTV
jgi:hypothetical protein